MTDILKLLSIFVLGIIVSVTIAGFKQKALLKIINIPLSLILDSVFFSIIVYIYSKIFSVPLDFNSVFPDTVSKLIGVSIYFIVCLITGIALGSVESRGLNCFFMKIYGTHLLKGIAVLFMVANIVLTSICVFLAFSHTEVTLRISEVCPHNFNLVEISDGIFPDYIELYNSSSSSIMLSDFYLSDDVDDIEKFQLPEVALKPNEYIIIWADGSDTAIDKNNELHANFKLSDKENVILSDLNNKIIDIVDLGTMKYNISMTLFENEFIEAYGTPGESNKNCIPFNSATLSSPTFSLESGFYTEDSITLEISAPRNSTIYYTTDGSIPSADSIKYTSAIKLSDLSDTPNKYVNIQNTVANYDDHITDETPVDKANVIRAIAIDKYGNVSDIVSRTYFVGKVAEKYKNYAVLSVISDPDDLFGDNGICVTGKAYDDWYNNTDRTTDAPTENFKQHGKMWEREATIQLWNTAGDITLDQPCGIRVQGNASRTTAIKRFSFFSRNIYSGNDVFDSQVFSATEATHSFYLRNDKTDLIAQDLVNDRELSNLDGFPVVCFLDGEFYCQTFVRERHDSTYFYEKYGVAEEDLVVISEISASEGTNEDLTEFYDLVKYLKTADTTDPQVYSEIENELDIQSFINFMVANIYCNNLDVTLDRNTRVWKSKQENGTGYNDGKWRFAAYDMDGISWSYKRTDSYFIELDSFRHTLINKENYGDVAWIYIPFFENLLRNDSFRNQFIVSYLDMMNTNYSMDSFGGEILKKYDATEDWLWSKLLTVRHSYAVENLKTALDISGSNADVTINTDGNGKVKINTTYAISENNCWNGTYISGMQITMTAEADEDWKFAGWEGSIESKEASLTVDLTEEGLDLKAIFVKTGGDN